MAGVYLYWKGILRSEQSTLAWKKEGVDYELLSPKMLGLALLTPFFFWMIGRSLADRRRDITPHRRHDDPRSPS